MRLSRDRVMRFLVTSTIAWAACIFALLFGYVIFAVNKAAEENRIVRSERDSMRDRFLREQEYANDMARATAAMAAALNEIAQLRAELEASRKQQRPTVGRQRR